MPEPTKVCLLTKGDPKTHVYNAGATPIDEALSLDYFWADSTPLRVESVSILIGKGSGQY